MPAFEPVDLYISDIHGEYEELAHIIRSACGEIPRAIDEVFDDMLSDEDKDALVSLICYPTEKMAFEAHRASAEDADDAATQAAQDEWTERTIDMLATLLAFMAGEQAVEQLELPDDPQDCIAALALSIQHAAVGRVHIVGDIYDRGPSPDLVMDELAALPALDIQWGNHDILWMGAALGARGCVACAVRICARYGNLAVLEENYGIDLAPLREFACRVYADDPCVAFGIKGDPSLSAEECAITAKVQKAMAYIQFKTDAQLIDENPSFGLEDRKLLHRIDYATGTIDIDGTTYPLKDTAFPTIDPADPYRLTPEEAQVLDYLVDAFTGCERLQRHVRLFLDKGSLYTIDGNNLLFHACVPLNADGSLMEAELFGQRLAGRALFDAVDGYVRAAYLADDPAERKRGLDMLWYLWLGTGSPLFAKSKMATFEIYQIADKAARVEEKNAFYKLLGDPTAYDGILREFGMDPACSRIICGHVPVKVKDGESPVKCDGKVLIIDGGMSMPYQATSGVAGFTVIAHPSSGALELATHSTFAGRRAAIEENAQLRSTYERI